MQKLVILASVKFLRSEVLCSAVHIVQVGLGMYEKSAHSSHYMTVSVCPCIVDILDIIFGHVAVWLRCLFLPHRSLENLKIKLIHLVSFCTLAHAAEMTKANVPTIKCMM